MTIKNAHDIVAKVAALGLTDPTAITCDPQDYAKKYVVQAVQRAIAANNWRAKLTLDDIANGLPLENADHGYVQAMLDFKIVLAHRVLAYLGEEVEPQM